MKITDLIISAILKKGLIYESTNADINVVIPMKIGAKEELTKVNIKCDHMIIRMEKEV